MPIPLAYDPIPYDNTHILYDPSDLVSVVCVHLSLFPVYAMVFYTAWFLITREIEPVVVVGGHLASEIFNKIVKHAVKQPRPDFHKDFGKGSYGLSYGMPSAHSQFMGFFAAYYICILLFQLNHLSKSSKTAGAFILASLTIFVASSRVYLLYHTIPQVLAGVILGVGIGLAYYVATSILRDTGVVDWVLLWPIVKYFYVKDSYYHCYQTYKDEYESYIERKKAPNKASGTVDDKAKKVL